MSVEGRDGNGNPGLSRRIPLSGIDDGRENEMASPAPVLADRILEDASSVFRQRRTVYGENWRMVGEVMKGLFPKGITLNTPADHNRFHILMLEVVKLTRYAEQWSNGGHEDSQLDLSVYAAMMVQIDREMKK